MLMFWDSNVVDRGYMTARWAAVAGTVTILGPFVSACAAWEVFTLRRFWGQLVISRSWFAVLTHRLATPLMVAVGLETVFLLQAGASGTGVGWRDWWFALMLLTNVLTWTFFGGALGLWLPPVFALAGALLVPFLFLTLPFGWEPLWIRHLTGVPLDCCSTSDVPDGRVVLGSLLTMLAVSLWTLAATAVRLGPYHVKVIAPIAMFLAGGLGLASAVQSVHTLGPIPAVARNTSALRCDREVCVWPEEQSVLAVNREAWSSVRAAWIDMGLPPPVTGIGPVESKSSLPLVSRSTDGVQVTTSMASLLPRAVFHCMNNFEDEQRNLYLDELSRMLARRLGLPMPEGAGPSGVAAMTDQGAARRIYDQVRAC
jgi:hypothetical protein